MENITKKPNLLYKGCLKETLMHSELSAPPESVARATYNDLAKIEEDIRKTIKALPKIERGEVLNSLKMVLEENLKLINSILEGTWLKKLKVVEKETVEMDLYQLTKEFQNIQEDYRRAKIAMKRWILAMKIERGYNVTIEIKERHSECIPFDLWVNGVAKQMLGNWDRQTTVDSKLIGQTENRT